MSRDFILKKMEFDLYVEQIKETTLDREKVKAEILGLQIFLWLSAFEAVFLVFLRLWVGPAANSMTCAEMFMEFWRSLF